MLNKRAGLVLENEVAAVLRQSEYDRRSGTFTASCCLRSLAHFIVIFPAIKDRQDIHGEVNTWLEVHVESISYIEEK